ncbi:MAG: hypothetical protein HY319_08760 [Armatimonadetes bacterium]|nr:hypothetical protein [Armatimonadota bacterium]
MRESTIQSVSSVVLYVLGSVVVGICLYPGLTLTWWLWEAGAGWEPAGRLLLASLGLGATYFLYGMSLLLVTAGLYRALGLRVHPGEYAYFSVESLKWVLGSSLHLVVKVTFMDFLVLSPWLTIYFRWMGARLGNGVLINSKYVHDVCLLEVGAGTVIGGEAVISCHAAEKGKLILKPVRIGNRCLIGQRSILMPGVEIGDGAVVGAQALVLKDQKIPAGETWVGIPARRKDDL